MTASTDYLTLARDLTRAHAQHLAAGDVTVTVQTLLVETGRCPSCAGPLLRGDRVAVCVSCGTEVERP